MEEKDKKTTDVVLENIEQNHTTEQANDVDSQKTQQVTEAESDVLQEQVYQENTNTKETNQPSEKKNSCKNETKNFERIKNRALILNIVKAILIGLTFALPIAGALFLFKRFEVISLGQNEIILISIGVFLFVGALTFLALRQNSRSIAMRLDREYKLDEKVQTMLVFKDVHSPMTDLQRQDADNAIASVRKVTLGIKRLWIYILLFVLAVAICTLSFMFNPLPEPPPEPEEEVPFSASELQLAALQELISTVEQSDMQSPYKENIVASLTKLYDEIQLVETVVQRDELLTETFDEIYLQTDQSSSAVEIINSLWLTNAKTLKLLAKALNYYEWPKSGEWESFTEHLTDFREGFVHPDAATENSENADETQIVEEIKNILLSSSANITQLLKFNEISTEDELYIVLTKLTSANIENADGTRVYGLEILAQYIETEGYTKAQRELDSTIAAITGDLYKALSQSADNTNTGERAMTVLAGIFGVKVPEFERPNLQEVSTDSPEDGDGAGAGGGIGGGPTYGSDDKVYDPFTNKYVEYGTILDKYYSIMFSKLQDGNYTDEEKKALEEYFKILYGGFEESEDNE